MLTLLDVCSYLGMGRKGESGKKGKGGGAGCQLCGPLESADSWWGWRPVLLKEKMGEKLAKEVEREVGTLGAGLPDVLRLTWGRGCIHSL